MSCFHVLRSRTRFGRFRRHLVPFSSFVLPDSFSTVLRALRLVLMFCAPGLVLGHTEGIASRVQVLRSRTRFWRYRRREVRFSYFALPNSFWAAPRASRPVFMFFDLRIIFDGTEGVGSRFYVLRSHTRFVPYRGRRIPFLFLVLPNSFSTVTSVLGPVFMFYALGLILGSTDNIGSRFQVLRSRTLFRRYRWHQVSFSFFLLPNSFSRY
jgi:hypothetical protein